MTLRVQSMAYNNCLDVQASNSVFYDYWCGKTKTVVVYQYGNGAHRMEFVTEGILFMWPKTVTS